jgi:lipooligosaccharide transport system ATP-binding protein
MMPLESMERASRTDALPVAARGLTKRYGQLTAVDGIDFEVQPRECVGFLGPNGAGKTTTVKMITCFSPVTAGEASIFGLDVRTQEREIKALLGICAQENSLDPDFTVRRNLTVFARYFDIPRAEAARRADELLELVQLTDKADVRIDELSGGMQRRLMLARALINRPRMLVLDEPTTGLDPQARQLIWGRVRRLRNEGATVLLTTHYMEEASQLCDRVVLMDEGRILREGPPARLVEQEIGREVVELWDVSDEVRAAVTEMADVVEQVDDRLYAYDRDGHGLGMEIGKRFPDQERLIRHASLEDVFLRLAGRSLKE